MNRWTMSLVVAASLACVGAALAADPPPPAVPTVSLSAAATAAVANDRMYAWLRAEADNADPVRAAADVNARMAKALARARAVSGIEVKTSGYSSYQVTEKNLPPRWRVTQTLNLEGADFVSMASLVSKLQAEDLLLLSGMNFAVSPEARRRAEDALAQQAIKAWQARAQNAARGFGFDGWRMGRVSIQTADAGRPQPMYRMAASAMSAAAPPVAVEGGDTDVTVTITGDAVLEGPRPPAR
ncbi:MAG: SIMPL domain-containing protein [Betaproteobacteria bacterium]